MGFALSKILWFFISPLSLVLGMLVAGVLLSLTRFRRTSMGLIYVGTFLFLLPALIPVGPALLAHLESQYPRAPKLPEKVDGILVLGGSFETSLSDRYGFPVANENIERVLDSFKLAQLYPQAKLVFSGGEGKLVPRNHPESQDVAAFIKYYGIEVPQRVVYESKSRNTMENFIFSRALAKPSPKETWILVTSAYHMPRALQFARAAGWTPLFPWPTDYRTLGQPRINRLKLDIPGNFYALDLALHEYAGMYAYRWGWAEIPEAK